MECETKCIVCHCPIKYKYVKSDHGCCQKHYANAMPIRCMHCNNLINLKSVIYSVVRLNLETSHQTFESTAYNSCNLCFKEKNENEEVKEKAKEINHCEYCTVNNEDIIRSCKHKICSDCNKEKCPMCSMFDTIEPIRLNEPKKDLPREKNNPKKAESFNYDLKEMPEPEILFNTVETNKQKKGLVEIEELLKSVNSERKKQNENSQRQNHCITEQKKINDEKSCKKQCKKLCCMIC